MIKTYKHVPTTVIPWYTKFHFFNNSSNSSIYIKNIQTIGHFLSFCVWSQLFHLLICSFLKIDIPCKQSICTVWHINSLNSVLLIKYSKYKQHNLLWKSLDLMLSIKFYENTCIQQVTLCRKSWITTFGVLCTVQGKR